MLLLSFINRNAIFVIRSYTISTWDYSCLWPYAEGSIGEIEKKISRATKLMFSMLHYIVSNISNIKKVLYVYK